LLIQSGKRQLKINFNDRSNYQGERARRGNVLPRGYSRIDAMRVNNDA
jgi:topoisomerase-4 subunit A